MELHRRELVEFYAKEAGVDENKLKCFHYSNYIGKSLSPFCVVDCQDARTRSQILDYVRQSVPSAGNPRNGPKTHLKHKETICLTFLRPQGSSSRGPSGVRLGVRLMRFGCVYQTDSQTDYIPKHTPSRLQSIPKPTPSELPNELASQTDYETASKRISRPSENLPAY